MFFQGAELDQLPAHQRADAFIDRLQALDRLEREVVLEKLELIAEAESLGLHEDFGHECIEGVISLALGRGFRATCDLAMIAVSIPNLPKMRQAFLDGDISIDHLRAICQVACQDSEEALLNEVSGKPVAHAFDLVQRIIKIEDDVEPLGRRSLTFRRDLAARGMRVEGFLPLEEGEMIKDSLDRLAKDVPSDGEVKTALAARRVDALFEVTQGPQHRPATVFVHVDLDRLTSDGRAKLGLVDETHALNSTNPANPTALGLLAEFEGGPQLSDETISRITCDSSVKFIAHQGAKSFDLGRAKRTMSTHQRRLLRARHPRCEYPGCSRPANLEGHHIDPYSKGGGTDLDNLTLLCRPHHKVVHREGWSAQRIDDHLVVTRPGGGKIFNRGAPTEDPASIEVSAPT